ncbi:pantoate--beta-alanine ligase [Streptomyces sp. NPDC004647]|uniref:pantoate--beta-alanine ligase n=1 Tax=Streptomyces sp. NPDC004647 TaxID=3154671 RepID=UPI0033A34729
MFGKRAAVKERQVHLARTRRELEDVEDDYFEDNTRTVVVMTMGALHEGHATLIRHARKRAGRGGMVVVTVFVNPLQFGPHEDFDRYPRTLDTDVDVCREAGADVVFAPTVETVYPHGQPQVRLGAGPMGERWEGASRPGHFDGMLTVVHRLLRITGADCAVFGEKDAQQLALIRRMVLDLELDEDVEIVGVPTVREADGLALSSRNRYLSAEQRGTALALSRALFAGRDAGRRAAGAAAVQGASYGREASAPDGRTAVSAAAQTPGGAGAPSGAGRSVAPGAEEPAGGPAGGRTPDASAADGAGAGAAPIAAAASADPDRSDSGGPAPVAEPIAVRGAARAVLDEAARLDPPLQLDYLALVDAADFSEIQQDFHGEAVLAVAARVGTTRLIDNVRLQFGAAR